MGKGNRKRVQGSELISSKKQVRQEADAGRADHLTIAWRLSKFDWDGPWGTAAFDANTFQNVIRTWCCQFERQTWAETFRAAGGRRQGNNSHPVRSENLTKQAKDRLMTLRLDEYDTLYSFRVSATVRVYGIRDSRAFEALWLDPWHGENDKAVYPTKDG